VLGLPPPKHSKSDWISDNVNFLKNRFIYEKDQAIIKSPNKKFLMLSFSHQINSKLIVSENQPFPILF